MEQCLAIQDTQRPFVFAFPWSLSLSLSLDSQVDILSFLHVKSAHCCCAHHNRPTVYTRYIASSPAAAAAAKKKKKKNKKDISLYSSAISPLLLFSVHRFSLLFIIDIIVVSQQLQMMGYKERERETTGIV